MIKTHNSNIKDTPPASIGEGVLEYLKSTGNTEKADLEQRVANAESNIRRIQSTRAHYRNVIQTAHRDLQNTYEREREEKRELQRRKWALANFDDSDAEERAETMLSRIRRLRYVDSVELVNGVMKVTTRLIFTDIRPESGSRDKVRRCIGAFSVNIDVRQGQIRIEQLLFSGLPHPHWTVGTGGAPCYGEHQDYFRKAFTDRDYFMLLEYVYAFLRSTDDGAAYMSSNDWIDFRDRHNRNMRPPIRKGSYVVVHSPYEQYDPTEHCQYAQVVRCNRGAVYLEFKEPFEFGHNMRGLCKEGHGYRVAQRCVHKITKKEYDDESVDIEAVRSRNVLEDLDTLPFGTTLTEAKQIL